MLRESWVARQGRVVRNAVLACVRRVHQPSGDRTTTDRGAVWNLRARSRHDAEDEIYELEELSPTAVSQAPRSLP